jgi:hypothetical protein
MPFNGFEQLEWIVPEPRQAFEDVTVEMLIGSGRADGRVRVHRGDGGVDAYRGTFGAESAAEIYQAKYFPRPPWTDSQKQNIRDSYRTARQSSDFNLSHWHLCVPSRPTKEDVRWFDEWALSLDVPATLIDGDDLVRLLNQPSSARARKMLHDWGVIGIENDSAILEAAIKIEVAGKRSGLTHIFTVFLRNVGARSADDLRISVNHSQTACVPWQADRRHWVDIGHGSMNPWTLAAQGSLHPGESVLALTIPIVQATSFPFSVAVKSWIRDDEPYEQHLVIDATGLKAGEPRAFAPGSAPAPADRPASQGVSWPALAYPEDEMAEALLATLAKHPKPEEYGIIEILAGDPADPTRAQYLPSLVPRGTTWLMDRGTFRRALALLVTTGWLQPSTQNSVFHFYRLNAHARKDRRFQELVDRETPSSKLA